MFFETDHAAVLLAVRSDEKADVVDIDKLIHALFNTFRRAAKGGASSVNKTRVSLEESLVVGVVEERACEKMRFSRKKTQVFVSVEFGLHCADSCHTYLQIPL